MGEGADAATRIAIGYLGSVIALIGGALVAVIGQPIATAAVCNASSDELALSCSLVWTFVLVGLGGLGCLAIALAAMRLPDWPWLVCAMGALLAVAICFLDQIGWWWYWLGLVSLPALAALASHRWRRQAWPWQRAALLAGLVVGCGLAGWGIVG